MGKIYFSKSARIQAQFAPKKTGQHALHHIYYYYLCVLDIFCTSINKGISLVGNNAWLEMWHCAPKFCGQFTVIFQSAITGGVLAYEIFRWHSFNHLLNDQHTSCSFTIVQLHRTIYIANWPNSELGWVIIWHMVMETIDGSSTNVLHLVLIMDSKCNLVGSVFIHCVIVVEDQEEIVGHRISLIQSI